jgi:hypothetical protein
LHALIDYVECRPLEMTAMDYFVIDRFAVGGVS